MDILLLSSRNDIYSVTFDGIHSEGVRGGKAKGLTFVKATELAAGTDPFAGMNWMNGYDVITEWDAGSSKQKITAYEGTALFDQKIADGVGNRINIKENAWFRRMSADKIELSPKRFSGSEPLYHLGNTVLPRMGFTVHAAALDNNGLIVSRAGLPTAVNLNLLQFNALYMAQGMYAMDFNSMSALQILAQVKYANRNVQNVLGSGITNTYTGEGSTTAEKAVISETGTSRIIVLNATAAKFAIGDSVTLTTGTFFQARITAIATYDASNKAITIQYQPLFVASAITDNKYIENTTGALATTSFGNNASDYIPVSSGYYVISGHAFVQPAGNVGLAWYTSAKTYISGVNYGSATGNGSYARPSNAAYVRYTINDADLTTSQLSVGFNTVSGSTGIRRSVNWTGESNSIQGKCGSLSGYDSKVAIKMLGIENFYGNAWNLLSGAFRYNNTEFYVHPNKLDMTAWPATVEEAVAQGYVKTGITLPVANGYVNGLGYDPVHRNLFLPTSIGGDSTKPVGDYFYTAAGNGFSLFLSGGSLNNGTPAGPFYVYVTYGLPTATWYVSAFGLYIPE